MPERDIILGGILVVAILIGAALFNPFAARAGALERDRPYAIQIVRLSDGDTFTARVIKTGVEIRIRPDDYDSAESKDPSRQVSKAESAAAKRAESALRDILSRRGFGLIKPRIVFTWSGRTHRNRHIGRVQVDGEDLGVLMVEHAMRDQREYGRTMHSIGWPLGNTGRIDWFPGAERRRK